MPATLEKLADFFSVTPQFLLDGPEDESVLEIRTGPGVFWDTFQRLARARGLTPTEAAKRAGLHPETVKGWKRGRIPTPAALDKLAGYFGITRRQLIEVPENDAIFEMQPAPIPPAPSTFWDTYRLLANERGLSPTAAAEKAGLNPSIIFYWKRGRIPKGKTSDKLANFFRVTKQYLLNGPEDKSVFETLPAPTKIKDTLPDVSTKFWSAFGQLAKSHNLSPTAAARQAGVKTPVTIWRKGAIPRKATLDKLAAFFNVTPQALIYGAKKKSSVEGKPTSTVFWETFSLLAKSRGLSPTAVTREVGMHTKAATLWRRGSIPRKATLDKLAVFFNVTPQCLLEGIDKKDLLTLTTIPAPTKFWVAFEQLAKSHGLTPTAAARQAGVKTPVTVWRKGGLPRKPTLDKLAAFFGVTPQCLGDTAEASTEAVIFWQSFKLLAEARGLNPYAMAKEIGLTRPTVSQWSKGSMPRKSTLKKISDYFGIPKQHLLKGLKKAEISNARTTPTVFWVTFERLAEALGLRPVTAARSAGIAGAEGAVVRWREGSIPQKATLDKLATYFGVAPQALIEGLKEEDFSKIRPVPNLFLDTFQQLARARGLTPAEAAQEAGISKGRTTAWRRGSMPLNSTIDKLAKYFGVTPEYLLHRSENEDKADDVITIVYGDKAVGQIGPGVTSLGGGISIVTETASGELCVITARSCQDILADMCGNNKKLPANGA